MSVGSSLPLSAPSVVVCVAVSMSVPSRLRVRYSLSSPALSPFATYSLCCMVVMVAAYVLGLPMPSSSSFFTRLASLYRMGFCANLCVATICVRVSTSPIVRLGSAPLASPSFSGSVSVSLYMRRNPSNFTTSPFATNVSSVPLMLMLICVFSISASAIWLAMVLFHIRS